MVTPLIFKSILLLPSTFKTLAYTTADGIFVFSGFCDGLVTVTIGGGNSFTGSKMMFVALLSIPSLLVAITVMVFDPSRRLA